MRSSRKDFFELENRLDTALRDIRKNGFLDAYLEGGLMKAMGDPITEPRTYEKDKALLITLVQKYKQDETNAEILMAAFGLLDGYEEIASVSDRRTKYYENGFPKDWFEDPQSSIAKREDAFIKRMNKCIFREKDLPAIIKSAPDYLDLPIPQYPEKNKKRKRDSADSYILTPDSPRWENSQIVGRDSVVADLLQELQRGTLHLQLIGMGGIGKSEILNKVYVNFANGYIKHSFDHVGLIFYDGAMNTNLARQLAFSGNDTRDAWNYLRNLCDKKSVLLLIDDIRLKQEEAPDEAFYTLMSLNATVLLTSRIPLDGFEQKTVSLLSVEECIQIFKDQRSTSNDVGSVPSEKDKALLVKIIEEMAGCNPLIVNRLGAMASLYNWNIKMLFDRLKKKRFDLRKGYKNEERLQEEINKLYTWDHIEKAEERNLLEAFVLFRAVPLDIETCTSWLPVDAGIEDEDECRLLLTQLSMYTWLMSYSGEDTVFFSMHQMVRAAVMAQAKIQRDNHLYLLEHCWGHISLEVQIDGAKQWSKAVLAIPGDKINYRIHIKNTGKIIMKNIVVRDILPPSLTYSEGSTQVYNSNNPEGVFVSDNIISDSGINIGNYAPGADAWIYFSAVVHPAGNVYGNRILRNRIEFDGGQITKEDTADVAVTL